jgi:predicted dehydrogenase
MRFGLFGTGPWATDVHGPALAAHPGAELVGVWGRRPERAAALAATTGATPYEDADALIADVDAVAIALPPAVQAPLAVRAAEAGRHLLLDKPVALTGEDADRVVAAAEGVRTRVFHTARFRPEVAAWLEAVRGAGDWEGGAVTTLAAIFVPGNAFGASPWRQERGALWDIGPHALDLLIAALGPVEDLTAVAGRGDTVHLVLRHATDATSTATLSLTAPPEAAIDRRYVYGPRGISDMPPGPTTPLEAYGNAIGELTGGEDGAAPSDAAHGRDVVRVLERAQAALDAA